MSTAQSPAVCVGFYEPGTVISSNIVAIVNREPYEGARVAVLDVGGSIATQARIRHVSRPQPASVRLLVCEHEPSGRFTERPYSIVPGGKRIVNMDARLLVPCVGDIAFVLVKRQSIGQWICYRDAEGKIIDAIWPQTIDQAKRSLVLGRPFWPYSQELEILLQFLAALDSKSRVGPGFQQWLTFWCPTVYHALTQGGVATGVVADKIVSASTALILASTGVPIGAQRQRLFRETLVSPDRIRK